MVETNSLKDHMEAFMKVIGIEDLLEVLGLDACAKVFIFTDNKKASLAETIQSCLPRSSVLHMDLLCPPGADEIPEDQRPQMCEADIYISLVRGPEWFYDEVRAFAKASGGRHVQASSLTKFALDHSVTLKRDLIKELTVTVEDYSASQHIVLHGVIGSGLEIVQSTF